MSVGDANAIVGSQGVNKSRNSTGLQVSSETFLTMMLAQLKNQDPLKPVDSSGYLGQLATLSQLEQTTKQTSVLEQLSISNAVSQAFAALGATVVLGDRVGRAQIVQASATANGVEAVLSDGTTVYLDQGVSIAL